MLTCKKIENWYADLPSMNYFQLDQYFRYQWNVPAAYYNPASAFCFILQSLGQCEVSPGTIRALPDGTPVAKIGDKKYVLIAPKNNMPVQQLYVFLALENSCDIILYAPNQTPDSNFKVYQLRPQILYNTHYLFEKITEDLLHNSKNILNKRSREILLKNNRECLLRPTNEFDEEHISTVLQNWEQSPAGKNKRIIRLAKDYATIPWALSNKDYNSFGFLGFRGSFAVSYTFLAILPAFPHIAAQVVSKSLNYSSVPGGYNSTSVWELYQTSKWCSENGISFINSSGTPYNTSHREFKSQFSLRSDDFEISHWVSQSNY